MTEGVDDPMATFKTRVIQEGMSIYKQRVIGATATPQGPDHAKIAAEVAQEFGISDEELREAIIEDAVGNLSVG